MRRSEDYEGQQRCLIYRPVEPSEPESEEDE